MKFICSALSKLFISDSKNNTHNNKSQNKNINYVNIEHFIKNNKYNKYNNYNNNNLPPTGYIHYLNEEDIDLDDDTDSENNDIICNNENYIDILIHKKLDELHLKQIQEDNQSNNIIDNDFKHIILPVD